MLAQIESRSIEEARQLGELLDELGYRWSMSRLRFFEKDIWCEAKHQFFHVGIHKEDGITRGNSKYNLKMSTKHANETYEFDGTVPEFLARYSARNDEFEVADDSELNSLFCAR